MWIKLLDKHVFCSKKCDENTRRKWKRKNNITVSFSQNLKYYRLFDVSECPRHAVLDDVAVVTRWSYIIASNCLRSGAHLLNSGFHDDSSTIKRLNRSGLNFHKNMPLTRWIFSSDFCAVPRTNNIRRTDVILQAKTNRTRGRGKTKQTLSRPAAQRDWYLRNRWCGGSSVNVELK